MPTPTPTLVASTRGLPGVPWHFATFGPYVPAMSESGEVAFQATLSDGRSGAFIVAQHQTPWAVIGGEGQVAEVASHPDLNVAGDLCFYGVTPEGRRGVFLRSRAGELRVTTGLENRIQRVGPAGPTMNEAGAVAFRADTVGEGGRQGSGIFVLDGEGIEEVAQRREGQVQGLPLMEEDGRVVFRHELGDGAQAISVWERGGAVVELVRTGDVFGSLGRFPATGAGGLLCFTGTLWAGGEGVFFWQDGRHTQIVDTEGTFESIRGALVDGAGRVVFYATPRGGTLGIYRSRHAEPDRIVGLGDALLGSIVVDLALNPVSINREGQLAIRVALADGSEAIVRVNAPN